MSDAVLVADVGTASLKAGYAGDNAPLSIIPSIAIKCATGVEVMEPSEYGTDAEHSKSIHPVERGRVKNWDQLENLWKIMMDDIGISSLDSTSVLFTEPPRSSVADRSMWAQMLFETFRVPSIYIANSASLSVFASGNTTGLVLDCGAGITSSVPVFEGLCLAHAINVMDYAGQDISYKLQQSLYERSIDTDLNFSRLLKERLSYVTLNTKVENSADLNRFSLPDGAEVSVQKSVFGECTETLFVNPTLETGGVVTQVYDSLKLCDDSLLKVLSQHVIISGGSSMIQGFGDRLQQSLQTLVAKESSRFQRTVKIRVMPSSAHREAGYTSQRKIAAWTGGSIVSSLDTFRQIKITRQEWEEDPEGCVRTKFV